MIILNALQTKAVEMACKNRFFVLTGGPGTGKTTTLVSIIKALAGAEIAVLAPTGKAAQRASQVTGLSASTIHRFIGKVKSRIAKGEGHGIPQVVIVDECSMVDATLFGSLMGLLNVYRGVDVRVIMVGDVDQLPSIGAGRVLADVIESGVVPVVRLAETMRQSEDSLIISNAALLNTGRGDEIKTGNDFEITANENPDFLIERIQETLKEATAKGLSIYNDIQVLVGQKGSALGVNALNTAIRENYNPAAVGKSEYFDRKGVSLFRVGDKVLCTENDYELGVVNGDQGIVKVIKQDGKSVEIIVTINGKDISFTGENIDILIQAWAMTVHRSQGSEYPLVLFVLHGTFMAWAQQRALAYTAITRGKSQVKVFCKSGDLAQASKNALKDRYTRLEGLLRKNAPQAV